MANLTGESLTEAGTEALRERLIRLRERRFLSTDHGDLLHDELRLIDR